MRWSIDPAHSGLDFRVKHLGIATVRGSFRVFEGHVEIDENGRPTEVTATIDVASIDTGSEQRDGHLRSADFFDAEKYPTMTFHSTTVERTGEQEFRMTGTLTMRGESHPVAFAVETTPALTDPWGSQRAAASAEGSLSRKQWGLTWNQVLEAGNVMVSDEVKFALDLSLVAAQPATTAA